MLCESAILEEFYKFKTGDKNVDTGLIERILYFYKTKFIETENQKKQMGKYDKSKSNTNNRKKSQQESENTTESEKLEESDEFLNKSKFKVILSTSRSDFPFVNIKDKENEKLQNNFTASFKGKRKVDGKEVDGESREKALAHFKALFKNAKSIFIFDKFLFADNESDPIKPEKLDNFEKLIYGCEIYSNKNCYIYLPKNQQTQYKQYQKSTYKNIVKQDQNNKNYNINNTHDRYIIIDGKIEIILTSGFEYLFDTTKDFTYVLKEK